MKPTRPEEFLTQDDIDRIKESGTQEEKLLLQNLIVTEKDRVQNQAQQRDLEVKKYDLDNNKLGRAVKGQSLQLVGAFTQASVALAGQSTQAHLKSTVAVVQIGATAVTLLATMKEKFETASKLKDLLKNDPKNPTSTPAGEATTEETSTATRPAAITVSSPASGGPA